MELLLIFLAFGLADADKLDRTYLPPPKSKFSGGSPGAIDLPLEYPETPFKVTASTRPTQSLITPSGYSQNEFSTSSGFVTPTVSDKPDFPNLIPNDRNNYNVFKGGYKNIPSDTKSLSSTEYQNYGINTDIPNPSNNKNTYKNQKLKEKSDQFGFVPISQTNQDYINLQQDFANPNRLPYDKYFDILQKGNIPSKNNMYKHSDTYGFQAMYKPDISNSAFNLETSTPLPSTKYVSSNSSSPNFSTPYDKNRYETSIVDITSSKPNSKYPSLDIPSFNRTPDIVSQKISEKPFKNYEPPSPYTAKQEVSKSNYKRPARPQAASDRNSVILKYENTITPEGFSYSYDTSNGIHADESGTATDGVKAKGSYSYTDDDGNVYTIKYTADEYGYRPIGDHLPTPPPIPVEIQAALSQIAREQESGISDDGSYDDGKYGHNRYQGIMYRFNPHLRNFNDGKDLATKPVNIVMKETRFENTKNKGINEKPTGKLPTKELADTMFKNLNSANNRPENVLQNVKFISNKISNNQDRFQQEPSFIKKILEDTNSQDTKTESTSKPVNREDFNNYNLGGLTTPMKAYTANERAEINPYLENKSELSGVNSQSDNKPAYIAAKTKEKVKYGQKTPSLLNEYNGYDYTPPNTDFTELDYTPQDNTFETKLKQYSEYNMDFTDIPTLKTHYSEDSYKILEPEYNSFASTTNVEISPTEKYSDDYYNADYKNNEDKVNYDRNKNIFNPNYTNQVTSPYLHNLESNTYSKAPYEYEKVTKTLNKLEPINTIDITLHDYPSTQDYTSSIPTEKQKFVNDELINEDYNYYPNNTTTPTDLSEMNLGIEFGGYSYDRPDSDQASLFNIKTKNVTSSPVTENTGLNYFNDDNTEVQNTKKYPEIDIRQYNQPNFSENYKNISKNQYDNKIMLKDEPNVYVDNSNRNSGDSKTRPFEYTRRYDDISLNNKKDFPSIDESVVNFGTYTQEEKNPNSGDYTSMYNQDIRKPNSKDSGKFDGSTYNGDNNIRPEIISTEKTIGEDFSGPKRPQGYDPTTGYFYK